MPDLETAHEWGIRVIERDSALYPAMLDLRKSILRKPLGLDLSATDLAAETEQIHFVLVNRETENVEGCAMLIEKSGGVAKVRQVAISESIQAKGLGQFLMKGVEETARVRHFSEIQLHARDSAVPFYLHIGYEIVGDSFIEVGLPHFLMRKKIA